VVVEQEYLGVLLNQDYDNHDVIIVVRGTSVDLQCPETDFKLGSLQIDRIKCYGFVKLIFWLELADDPTFGTGIFCFSSINAQDLFDAISHNASVASSPLGFSRRFSRRQNMSWSSQNIAPSTAIGEGAAAAASTASAAGPVVVFGKTLSPADAAVVGIAVAVKKHIGTDKRELAVDEGDTYPVLATKAFLPEGFWVVKNQDTYSLISESCVQVGARVIVLCLFVCKAEGMWGW
jgi:hypothetical protein